MSRVAELPTFQYSPAPAPVLITLTAELGDGREIVVFSPNLNRRDFEVSFAPEYRFFDSSPALSEYLGRKHPDAMSVGVVPLAPAADFSMMGFYRRFGKRAIDLALTTGALVMLSPLLLAIAAAIRLTSRGPVFYVQERIGYRGRPFPFFKFRTMIVGAERVGAGILCLKNDPRITRVGRLLRRFSLDELPQLANVLRGEMSLIGPRPGLDYQASQYTSEQRRRLDVRPGLTGWAQVNGRNAITWDERIKRDLEYVERLSLVMDLRILARTFGAVLKSESLIAQKDYFKENQSRASLEQ